MLVLLFVSQSLRLCGGRGGDCGGGGGGSGGEEGFLRNRSTTVVIEGPTK